MRRKIGWVLAAIFLVLSTACLLLAGSQNEFLSDIGGMFGLLVGIIPLWMHFLAAGILLVLMWRTLRDRSIYVQLGVCFLTAGWIFGLLWPALGVAQETLPRMVVTVITSLEFHPELDAQRLQLECSFLPFAGTSVGATATFYNPGDQAVEYATAQPPFCRWMTYANYMEWAASGMSHLDKFVTVSLTPGETKRLFLPLSPNMFGALVYVEAHTGMDHLASRSRPLVAFCSMLSGSRNGLLGLGALCALAGLVSLGVGFYRRRLGASSK